MSEPIVCQHCGEITEPADYNADTEECFVCHDATPFSECMCERCYEFDGPFRGLDEDTDMER